MTAPSLPPNVTSAGVFRNPVPRIISQHVRDFSFRNMAARQGLAGGATQRISVQTRVESHRSGADQHEVVTTLRIAGKSDPGGDTLFELEIDYAGVFGLFGVPPDQLDAYLHIECPRMTFPFVRRIVAQATQDAGFPALILGEIDFASIHARGKGPVASGGQDG